MVILVLRGAITAALVAAVIGCVSLVVFARVADAVVVTGGSMEPAIPRGSLINPTRVEPTSLRVGQVVTVRGDNGVLVTHRISEVHDLADGRFLELRGDANPDADPALVPVGSVLGRVDAHLRAVGYLLALLSMPVGLVSVLSLLGVGLLGLRLLEDLEAPEPRFSDTRALA